MGKIETDLKAAGAIVYAISNEGSADLEKMKADEKLGDTFVFLSDKDSRVADRYAGHYPGQATLKPATIVVGTASRIVYAFFDENYRVRAAAQDVLAAVRQVAAESHQVR